MNFFLLAVTILLVMPVLLSTGYVLLTGIWLRRWLEEPHPVDEPSGGLSPVSFFRPLKSNVAGLADLLEAHIRALRPEDQLLLGVNPESLEAAIAERLRQAFPDSAIVVIPCFPGVALNPKISKLRQMESSARHEHWMLCDGEAMIDTPFLAAFRQEWKECDVLTTCYRFERVETWVQQLDAAAALLTLWPGLMVLRRKGKLRLTIGACTGFRRSDLHAVGGWAAFGDELAEDYHFGRALAALGNTIHLSRAVLTLGSDPLSWDDYWRHQRRVAITYRIANPVGFAGSILTQGVAAGVLLAALWPREWWAWGLLALVWSARTITAGMAAQRLQFPLRQPAVTVLVASLVETACWGLSWLSRTVWWGGVRWRLSGDGKLRGAARP